MSKGWTLGARGTAAGWRLAAWALVGLTLACGGGGGVTPPDAGTDAGTDAGMDAGTGTAPDTQAPTVSLQASRTEVGAGHGLTLTATASDPGGVAKVEFFDGDTRLGEDTQAPYTLEVDVAEAADGAHAYTARATDEAGNTAASDEVAVHFDRTGPSLTLVGSAPLLRPEDTLVLTAEAADAARVEFFSGDVKLGEATAAPFTLEVPLAERAEGVHVFTARATDALGNETTSAALEVRVDGTAPGVGLAGSHQEVTGPAAVQLTVSAEDDSGIARVELYEGTTLLGQSIQVPHTFQRSFSATDEGTFTFTARALDAAGNEATSSEVAVVVKAPDTSAPTVTLTASTLNVTRDDTLTLTAGGADNVGITRLELFEDGTLLTTLSGPGTHTLPMGYAKNGLHTYSARAWDAAGNSTTSSPLTVHVSIRWTRLVGAGFLQGADALALDAQGHLLVGGSSYETLHGQTHAGGWDVFVSKFHIATTERRWTRMSGTSEYEAVYALATDASGGVYVAGETGGPLEGEPSAGTYDAFVSRYDSNGNRLWTRQWGSPQWDAAYGLVVDTEGVVVMGSLSTTTAGGGSDKDGFLRKYSHEGVLLWSKQLGTEGWDTVRALAADTSGTLYVAGSTFGTFPDQTRTGSADQLFVARFDPEGNLLGVQQWNTSASARPLSMVVNPSRDVYVAGAATGALPGATSAGGEDAFVVKLAASGAIHVQQWGSAGTDRAHGVALDFAGNAYVACTVAGGVDGNSFLGGSSDAYLVKLSYNLDSRAWSRQFGSAEYDTAEAVLVSGNDVFVVGTVNGPLDGQQAPGPSDGYVRRMGLDGSVK